MEVIAVTVAAISCALVGINTIFSAGDRSSVKRGSNPEEELGKAATNYLEHLEKTQSVSLSEAERDLKLVVAEYLSRHERDVAARERKRRRAS